MSKRKWPYWFSPTNGPMIQKALIAGAKSGFGAGAAWRFGDEGWKFIQTRRRKERIDTVVSALVEDEALLEIEGTAVIPA